ncbi:outer membrane protein assembly factor BamB [Legionella israelensis]|uniref:outer membrane protein assembly factor BamB n=1 Tax=Legionella israelensis TaxID=454 RepID=UPI00118065E6|nr:outer membrane protein assembly factor BamB [Legionella israelensis]QDP72515.1 outer membrane protein assembly factor BamB [Legionella israelensis]
MKKILILLVLCHFIQACTKVEDYVLGKDNTPKPSPLAEITPKIDLVRKWSAPVGQSHKNSAYLKLKPVIKGQTIYTTDINGQVQAMNKSSAQIQWSTKLKNKIISGPTVAEKVVAVTTDASTLVLLDSSNGKELWEKKVSGEILAKPLINRDKIVVKTIDGNLYAFNLLNGQIIWEVNHGAPNLILKAGSSPVLMEDKVLVGYSDGKIDVVDLQTGRLLWQRNIVYPSGASDVERLVDIDADPIVRGDTVYLATYQGYVGGLSLKDGQFIWSKPSSVYKNIILNKNTLYLTDSDDVIWAINASNGLVKWKQTDLKARGLTEPAVMGHRLIVGDKTGLLHVLSTSTGEFLARTQLSGPITISPVIDDKKLYVQTANGLLNQLLVS